MKSICIKTNNSHILDYLQKELNVIELNNICFTCNEFKNYKNIIVHYTGTDDEIFYDKISMQYGRFPSAGGCCGKCPALRKGIHAWFRYPEGTAKRGDCWPWCLR